MLFQNVRLTADGTPATKEIHRFGGPYSLLEKLKLGGTGSPKMIYKSGIPDFDTTERGLENEIGFVNVEILKNGLLLHLNRNQRTSCVGVKLRELQAINLVAYRIEVKDGRLFRPSRRIVHRGELEFVGKGHAPVQLTVITQNFKALVKFFQKSTFTPTFFFSVSTNPPEKDLGSALSMLEELF